MRVYATADQVAELVGITGVTDVTLRRASRDVDTILRGAVYDVDADGMPTRTAEVDLLAEMVAEQVAWYAELGDELGASGMGGGSIGSVSLPDLTSGGRKTADQVLQSPKALALARANLDFRVYS